MSQLNSQQIQTIIAYYEKHVDDGPIPDRTLLKAVGRKLKLTTAQNDNFNGHMTLARKKNSFPGFIVRYGRHGGTVRATPEEMARKQEMENNTSTMLAQVEKNTLSSSGMHTLADLGSISASLPQPSNSVAMALHTLYAEQASMMLDLNALSARFNAAQAKILELLQQA